MKDFWIVQTKIQHYRVPLFNKLTSIIGASGNLLILGHTKNVVDFEKESQFEYKNYELKSFLGMHYWKGLVIKVFLSRPHHLILTASPRNISSWLIVLLRILQGMPVVGWSKIYSDNPKNSSFLSDKLRSIYYSLFTSMIVYGASSKKELEKIGYRNKKIIVANNTIDTDYIQDSRLIIESNAQDIKKKYDLENSKVILFIGRLDPEKCFYDLLLAWDSLKSRDKNYKLVFVGDGRLYNDLVKKVQSMNTNRILVIGRVPQYFDYSWISLASVLVLPGQVGLSIQQGMALSTPVIIADEKGVDAEIIQHNVTGWRYEKNNIAELSKSIDYVLHSETSKVVNYSKELIFNHYTLGNMSKKIYSTFRSY